MDYCFRMELRIIRLLFSIGLEQGEDIVCITIGIIFTACISIHLPSQG